MNKVAEQDSLELKPCPFCGGTEVNVLSDDDERVIVQCDSCYAQVWAFLGTEAIAVWNTRPEANTLSQMRAVLAEIADLPGEINPSNYDHGDACELNRQFCYAITIADAALTTTKIEKE